MTSQPLYRALYVLVHTLFAVYKWLSRILDDVGTVFVGFCHEFGASQRINHLKNEIASSGKVPKHLTLLLGQEQPSYEDLANVVHWCITNRIVFLSFYDYRGILQKHYDKLEKEVSKKMTENDHVVWHNTPGSTYKNGFIGRKIHIKLLSKCNGKPNIALVARNLCDSKLTSDSLDQELHKDFEFPDPDLGLCCGGVLSFFAYPPWQIRVTQFLRLKTHHRLKYSEFLEKLHVFGKCEQRYGK